MLRKGTKVSLRSSVLVERRKYLPGAPEHDFTNAFGKECKIQEAAGLHTGMMHYRLEGVNERVTITTCEGHELSLHEFMIPETAIDVR